MKSPLEIAQSMPFWNEPGFWGGRIQLQFDYRNRHNLLNSQIRERIEYFDKHAHMASNVFAESDEGKALSREREKIKWERFVRAWKEAEAARTKSLHD